MSRISARRLVQPAILALFISTLASAPAFARGMKHVTPAAVPAFSIHGIGPPFFFAAYLPNGINDAGMVAGTNVSATPDQGFFFAKGTVHAATPPPGMAGGDIFGINNSRAVAAQGCLTTACDSVTAFTGTISKGHVAWERLPPPAGASLCFLPGCDSTANGIGQTGDITGQYAGRAILWMPGSPGTYTSKRLAYTDSTRFNRSSGVAVDSFGDAAGTEGSGSSNIGILWPRHGSPVILPACQSILVRGGATFEYPYAVLAKGSNSKRTVTVAGKCLVKSSKQLGFAPCIWHVTISGSMDKISAAVRLDASDGSDAGRVGAINQKGWIAGNQGDATSSPTLWIKRHPYLLNNLIPANSGWKLGLVYAMNKRGQITVVATNQNGTRALLLTPR